MAHYSLFPTAVGVYQLGRSFTETEMAHIRGILSSVTRNLGNSTSVARNILDDQELQDLKEFCCNSLADYAGSIVRVEDGHPRITQSWLNRSVKGEWHHQHRHPNSLWSGVLYVVAGDDDKIVFHRSPEGFGSFQLATSEWNEYNSPSWWVPSRTGELLVFPSDLQHSVPETTTYERISLSFNTFPTTTIGSAKNLTELAL